MMKYCFRLWLMAVIFLIPASHAVELSNRSMQFAPLIKTKAPIASIEIINSFPHQSDAFTQGLMVHDGFLYESTGNYGRSGLFQKELETGKILKHVKMADEYFGEGMAILNKKIYQLTWKNETLLVFDLKSLSEIRKMKYRGEGWGLATNGKNLLMSNGTSAITFHDPETFHELRRIVVRDGDIEIDRLNELEYIKGEIWANIFMEDVIVRISPKNGKVKGWIDLSALRSYLPHNAHVDVLNGIAYEEKTGRIFVTGKYWPKVFEIRIIK